jgi:glycolate oxidase FAD binding subunit
MCTAVCCRLLICRAFNMQADLQNTVLQTLSETVAQVNRAAQVKSKSEPTSLTIVGGASKSFYGEPCNVHGAGGAESALEICTRDYSGIIDYEPSELVITARAGTSLLEIERVLAQSGQMLGFEPPYFGEHATIGGVVASGLSGPRRAAAGSVKDFVLGAKVFNAQGEHLNFGGQVIKNVAGYDVSRLMTGSLGILGLLTQVSLKLLPVPLASVTIVREANQADALRLTNECAGQPLPITATCWFDGRLTVRLSGAQSAVNGAVQLLGGQVLADADDFWIAVREQTLPFFRGNNLWRLSLPSVAPATAIEANTLIEWNGSQRWLYSDQPADTIRKAARILGGSATLFRTNLQPKAQQEREPSSNARVSRFQALDPVSKTIHQKLKQQFDPNNIFNPGRLYADL